MSVFKDKLRRGEKAVGYWVVLDSPASTERLARTGYDYVCLDQQHGLLGQDGVRHGLLAIDAGARLGAVDTVGLVRVAANDLTWIGFALDAGATGVIVPLVSSPADAAAAVRHVKYPPLGERSYGPMRSGLRIGPEPAAANDTTMVFVMIETPGGLAAVEEIAATPGLDGLYVGPSDLTLALGGARPGDPAVAEQFEGALDRVVAAAHAAGIAAGIHTPTGAEAAARLAAGFDFATVHSDLVQLETVAAGHLADARD